MFDNGNVDQPSALTFPRSQAWEPHIKPELQKAGHAARSWWNKRRRRSSGPVAPHGAQGPDDGERRSGSPDVSDERPAPDTSRFNSFINSALQLPNEMHPGGFLRQRPAANRQGAATPNETVVEMSELDKASPTNIDLSPYLENTAPADQLTHASFLVQLGEPLDLSSAYESCNVLITRHCPKFNSINCY